MSNMNENPPMTMVVTAGSDGGEVKVVEIEVLDDQKNTGILPPQAALDALAGLKV